MPVMNGLDAAEELRRTLPSTKIVFLTMLESAGFETKAKSLSHAFVSKYEAANKVIPIVKALLGAPPQHFRYPWQQLVADAFASPPDTLQARISRADRAIAARLREREQDRDELILLEEALHALERLLREIKQGEKASLYKQYGVA